MVRKLILSALISTAAVGGLTAATASAQTPAAIERHDRDRDRGRFQVLVRHHNHWDVHGTYRDRDAAERVARRLERQGLDARVERAGRR